MEKPLKRCLFVFDRRSNQATKDVEELCFVEDFSYHTLLSMLAIVFGLDSDNFVISTTGRNQVTESTFDKLVCSGDTLYLLDSLQQPLEVQVIERVEFQPHYDTIVKSGMYEYYASEGHQSPLCFAFAELIDNALGATADNMNGRFIKLSVHIDDGNNHCISVYDNGRGMSTRQLNNWAIYRLSKFNREERDTPSSHQPVRTSLSPAESKISSKSINSDISWFGVGGKQAVFFIGSSTRVITKTKHSCDVHEFTLSTAEFQRKEMNKQDIFSGFIVNRKARDHSHLPPSEKIVKKFIDEETAEDSFTKVIVTDIKPEHINYMRTSFKEATSSLAHIYHYYLHGPEGNSVMSTKRKNIGAADINIWVSLYEGEKQIHSVDLKSVEADVQSHAIRSAADSFEFIYIGADKTSKCQGIIRYHPFLYDTESCPLIKDKEKQMEEEEENEDILKRSKKAMIECYWNGRLIPYTSVHEFNWCRPKKSTHMVPPECYTRLTGCLFTNDDFKVSTNKLTFIDLEAKLKDPKATYYQTILGQVQKYPSIHKSFTDWLRDCHEKYDKKIKFFAYEKSRQRLTTKSRNPQTWSIYKAIMWDSKVFRAGDLVKTRRTNPYICATIKSFMLCGDIKGDVYGNGGEVELIQEPSSIYGGIRVFPINRIDKSALEDDIQRIIDQEKTKLPATINLEWPLGNSVKDGAIFRKQISIGAMSLTILNKLDEVIERLPNSGVGGRRKLNIRQQIFYKAPDSKEKTSVACYITGPGKTWPYWFKRIDTFKEIGSYEIVLQVLTADTNSDMVGSEHLPTRIIRFYIESLAARSFSILLLESPLRVGIPFAISLRFLSEDGRKTEIPSSQKINPIITAQGLEVEFSDVKSTRSNAIINNVTLVGSVNSLQGKTYTLNIKIPGFVEDTQSTNIRLFPGAPHQIEITNFSGLTLNQGSEQMLQLENGSEFNMEIVCVDLFGNTTCEENLVAICKIHGCTGVPNLKCDLSKSGHGKFVAKLIGKKPKGKIPKKKEDQTQIASASIQILQNPQVPSVERKIILEPSSEVQMIELFYTRPNGVDVKLKKGQDIYLQAGSFMENITYTILDEAKRKQKIDHKIASRIKVNWVAENDIIIPKLERGILPDCSVPTVVSEVKFCQISLSLPCKTLSFSFNLRPIAGEAKSMRVCPNLKSAQLGVLTTDALCVDLIDEYGNRLFISKHQLNDFLVTGKGLDNSQIQKILQDGGLHLTNLQFNEGPLGTRVVDVTYQGISQNFILQLCAGTPVMIKVLDWTGDENFAQLLSGDTLSRKIQIQLYDGWGNEAHLSGINVLMTKDNSIKLTPLPMTVKTDEHGRAQFPHFTVFGKCGSHNLQPKAVYVRKTIQGPKLPVLILPNTEKPVKVVLSFNQKVFILTPGDTIPEISVRILSEKETEVTSSWDLALVVWKENSSKEIPPNAEWHTGYTKIGKYTFKEILGPLKAAKYSLAVCLLPSRNSRSSVLISDHISMTVMPGPPVYLQPEEDLGTPTVSNSKQVSHRTLVRSMRLRLKDVHGNWTCLRGIDGKRQTCYIEICIKPFQTTKKKTIVPKFDGFADSLRVPMSLEGLASIQNIVLCENSPGVDGCQYELHCQISPPSSTIESFILNFYFCNDAEKLGILSELTKKRDHLKKNCAVYEKSFKVQQDLIEQFTETVKKIDEDIIKAHRTLNTKPNLTIVQLEEFIKQSNARCSELKRRPIRRCRLQRFEGTRTADIIGKIGHLGKIKDPRIAKIISWLMIGDMDCVLTTTVEKANEINTYTNGKQQVLPYENLRRKHDDWDLPLPKVDKGFVVKGNPRRARSFFIFEKNEVECKEVFKVLVGDTIIMDDLVSANQYRRMVVKHAYCPTILTLDGYKVRSTGKFGGRQNKCPENLELVFGEPTPANLIDEMKQNALLNELLGAMKIKEDLERDQTRVKNASDVRRNLNELKKTKDELKETEKEINKLSLQLKSNQKSTEKHQLAAETHLNAKKMKMS